MASGIGQLRASHAHDAGGDWLLDIAADFLDVPSLYAYLLAGHRCLRYASSSTCWDGWRTAWLDAQLPSHVHWRPASDGLLAGLPCRLRRAACAHKFARGVQLYEARDFDGAVTAMRGSAAELPAPHRQLMCRLADALYGKAMDLQSSAARASASAAAASAAATGRSPPPGEGEASRRRRGRPLVHDDDEAEDGEEGAAAEREAWEVLLAEARGLYEAAMAEDPADSYAVNGLALFARSPAEKRGLLERAVQLDGANPYALANLGADLLGEDDHLALSYLQRALIVNPRLFYARLSKCQALARVGDLDGAVATAAEQLRLRPGDVHAQRLLSQLRARRDAMRWEMLLV